MAQHDYVIANGTGAAVRSDLNAGFAAIVSQNSGATAPSTTYAYQSWADTSAGVMKMRNGANNAWISLYELDGTFLAGDISLSAGAAATPSLFFTGDTNTGIYSPGADQFGISTGGTGRLAVSTTAVSSTLAVDHPLGAVGTPSITFTGDLNTGIWSPAADTIAFSEGGAEAMRIDPSSRLLVGTSTSATDNIDGTGYANIVQILGAATGAGLKVGNTADFARINLVRSASVGTNVELGTLSFGTESAVNTIERARVSCFSETTGGSGGRGGRLVFSTTADGASSPTEAMRINNQRELLIGTTTRTANGGVLQVSNGITFPATQVACTDPNTLDDYEEGAWTPNVGGNATYNTQTGFYTKTGRMVVASFTLNINILGTGSAFTVSGLPFAPTDVGRGGVSIYYWAGLAQITTYLGGFIGGSASFDIVGEDLAATAIEFQKPVLGSGARIDGIAVFQVA